MGATVRRQRASASSLKRLPKDALSLRKERVSWRSLSAGSRTLRSQLRAHIPARGKNTPARLEVSRVTTSASSEKLALRDDGLPRRPSWQPYAPFCGPSNRFCIPSARQPAPCGRPGTSPRQFFERRAVAQSSDAPRSERRGRRFRSSHPEHQPLIRRRS